MNKKALSAEKLARLSSSEFDSQTGALQSGYASEATQYVTHDEHIAESSKADSTQYTSSVHTAHSRKPKAKNKDYPSDALAEAALRAAVNQKCLDAKAIDLRGVSDLADYFVILSGTSERHVKGIADKIKITLQDIGQATPQTNGYEDGQWIVLDYGDVVVHVFYEPVRQYYEFDALWKAAQPMPLDETLAGEIRSLRTGVFR